MTSSPLFVSQRRREAVRFLSRISLDGTCAWDGNSSDSDVEDPAILTRTKTLPTSKRNMTRPVVDHFSDSERYLSSDSNKFQDVLDKSNVTFVKSIKNHKFHGERIFMVTKKRLPILVCSFIPYGNNERNRMPDLNKEAKKQRQAVRPRPTSISVETMNYESFGVLKWEDEQEVSYGKLLVPSISLKEHLEKKHAAEGSADFVTHNHHSISRTKVLSRKPGYNKWYYSYDQSGQKAGVGHSTSPPPENPTFYNPALLDDPELIAGKHRTLLTFSSYVTSVIDYVRPCDLKSEINDKFKEKFPEVRLTLSKLRSIKRDMCKVVKGDAELVTVAQAYVYFEKLILRGLIDKHNRKLCAAASLILSAKLNDFKGEALKVLIERAEGVFRLNRREMIEWEFAVLVALEFGLHVPSSEVFPHYQRLLCES